MNLSCRNITDNEAIILGLDLSFVLPAPPRVSIDVVASIDNFLSRYSHRTRNPDMLRGGILYFLQEISKRKHLLPRRLETALDPRFFTKLLPVNASLPYFYGLPKLHKPGIPLRPIISGIGSVTHPLAKYLAGLLSPFL